MPPFRWSVTASETKDDRDLLQGLSHSAISPQAAQRQIRAARVGRSAGQ
ncbi:hypothetical protein [Pseudarthrobacter polychromogenes]|nr:hypothetical protein [Pseudarthrobacter polychromogenes]